MDEGLMSWLTTPFMSHGHCYLWRTDLVLLHVISDTVIALAYFSIPAALWVLMQKRKDLEYQWAFVLFAWFILACGTTHLMSVWNVWNGDYYISGAVKLVTAAVSLLTAVAIWPLIPKAIQLPKPMELQAANANLRTEISAREASEATLLDTKSILERKVDELTRTKQRLEEEIQARSRVESRFKSLFDSSPNAILVINRAGRIEQANDQAESLIGNESHGLNQIEAARVLGMGSEASPESITEALASHIGKQRSEWRVRTLAGRSIPAEIAVSPLNDEPGKPFIVTLTDISDRKWLEKKREEQRAALERSNQELEQFAFIASHDLREPLRKILSFTQILVSGRYGEFTDKGNEFVGYIRDAATRMDDLLENLLLYSRVTSRGQEFVDVDLNQALEDVQKDLQLAIDDNKADITVDELITLPGDPSQIRQLFQNLISNSLKYRKEDVNPVIRISGRFIDDDRYQIAVQDNGIGFNMKYHDQIFEVFKRLHGRFEYSGTGMGLSICRKIVDRHGGTIHAESEPGQGTRFLIELPL